LRLSRRNSRSSPNKHTHPDLAGAESEEAFVAVRGEYEVALLDFERHRFGASAAIRDGGRPGPATLAEVWAAMALMLKRGFPKEPRHDKERLRYEYARWRLRGSLVAFDSERAGAARDLFDAFEAGMLVLGKDKAAHSVLDFLSGLIDYAGENLPAMQVALAHALVRLRADSRLESRVCAFPTLLASRLGIGPVFGDPSG